MFVPIAVNPMHHGNSTSISDWSLRRAGSHLHLLEKYSTGYWRILCASILGCDLSVLGNLGAEKAKEFLRDRTNRTYLVPMVSKHIDFLETLVKIIVHIIVNESELY